MGNCACGGEVVLRCEKCGADWLDDLCCQNNALRARVAELEAKLAMAIAVGDETADLRKAAEQRAKRLEGALEAAANGLDSALSCIASVRDGEWGAPPIAMLARLNEQSISTGLAVRIARAALAAGEAPASSAASDNKCECGADDYCVSATLIACRSCGRTWGRCNGKWVLDTETVPGGKS